jgi:hypothetical protein
VQVLPEIEPLVRFHLGDPAHLEGLDKIGHTLPQVGDLLESAHIRHLRSIIEFMFDCNTNVVLLAQQVIEDYRNAFRRGDLDALVSCFGFPLQVASVVGDEVSVTVAGSEGWPEVLQGVLNLYQRLEVADAVMLAVEISQPLDPVAVIRVHWRLERVDGTSVYDFTAVYTLAQVAGGLKIISVAHDELLRMPPRSISASPDVSAL